MQADLDMYLRLAYVTHVVPEQSTDGSLVYVATHPQLPGCMAHGDTPEEALQNLAEARELYIRTLLERGLEVPTPRSSVTVIWRSLGTGRESSQPAPQVPPVRPFASGISPLTPLGSG